MEAREKEEGGRGARKTKVRGSVSQDAWGISQSWRTSSREAKCNPCLGHSSLSLA